MPPNVGMPRLVAAFVLVAAFAISLVAASKTTTDAQAIAAAVIPLPESLRSNAGVVRLDSTNHHTLHSFHAKAMLLLVLPPVLSIAFFLIADIDSPGGGVIRVRPQNLESVAQTLNGR